MSRSSVTARSTDRRWIVPPLIAALILVADQISKLWVVQNLGPEPERRQIFLVGEWLSLLYVRNTGVAFGLFQSIPQVFIVTSLLITAGVIVAYIFYLPNRLGWLQFCVGLIIGGALGNVMDRIRLGYVVDFVKVGWWPIFNLADSSITVGILMLAVFLIFFEEERPRAPRPMPRDDALLNELLNQDPVLEQPARRANPGRTDSGRRLLDEQ